MTTQKSLATRLTIVAGAFALTAIGSTALAADNTATATQTTTYVAELQPLNSNVTGSEAAGEAKIVIKGDEVTISVDAQGVPANTVHWQHFHGFKNGDASVCATADNDANGDGIVDLKETNGVSGVTMVPFDKAPAAMKVAKGTYPKADADGAYSYQAKVSLTALEDAFGKAFDGKPMELGKRVIYIHGVPDSTELPDSVASLGPIPAHVTLPIACGKFVKQ